ncbi:MAG: S8 family serine peptidase [Candidatus Eisenbacteria bacterium]|nr:S8 family serine peptidase [Candidatus Eisenbacteria bacterium]
MPEDLLARLNFLGVERIATVAANWRYLSPADTLDELGEPKKLFDFRDAYQLIVRDDHRLCEAVAELRRLPAVLSAHCEEPFELFQGSFPNGPPNDPVYPDQWHLNNTGQIEAGAPCDPFIDINAPEAWAISNIAGSPIAILDSGISTASPDLAPFVAPSPISRNFTSPDPMIQPDPDDWNIGEHGTKVAAVAAARGNNAVQIAGTANSHPLDPQPMLVALRVACQSCVFPSQVPATPSRVLAALSHLAGYPGVRVSNHSYGDTGAWRHCYDQPLLRQAFRNSYYSNQCLFASIGNGASCSGAGCNPFGPDSCFTKPASYEDFCFAVSAVDCRGQIASSLQAVGSFVDATGPGGSLNTIWTVDETGATSHSFCCTSAAAPMISGLASLAIGAKPALTNDDVYALLRRASAAMSSYGLNPIDVGQGLVKGDNALRFLKWPYLTSGGTNNNLSQTSTEDLGVDLLTLRNIPGTGVPAEEWTEYNCRKYRVTWTGQLKNPIVPPVTFVHAWHRGRSTTGARDINAALAKRYDHLAHSGYAELQSLTTSGMATFVTYTYKLMDKTTSQFVCWYPFKPDIPDPDNCPSSPAFKIGYGALVIVPPGSSESIPEPDIVSLTMRGQAAYFAGGKLVLRFGIQRAAMLTVRLYDVTGRLVSRVVTDLPLGSGEHELFWPIGEHVSVRGIYLLDVSARSGNSEPTLQGVQRVVVSAR